MDLVGGLVLAVFIGTYLAISSEKINRTAAALLGTGLVGLILWIAWDYRFEEFVGQIQWGVVLFVTAMMIIVAIAAGSGMFQFLAIEITRPTQADTRRLFVVLLFFVFIISLVLDTTSTMLIMGPLTIELCKSLELDFRPFLISEAIVCNFSSTALIVSAVPNIVIAEETLLNQGLLFGALMPLSVIIFLVSLPILLRYFDVYLPQGEADLVDELLLVNSRYMIRSQRDFYASIIAIIALVIAFTVGHSVGFQPAMVAVIVAAILLMFSREWVDDVLKKVNWGTVFFLVGIFGLVVGLSLTGVIDEIGVAVGALIGNNKFAAVVFMTWIPGLLSAVIDNIPISAVVAPIAKTLAPISPLLPVALIFGVNVGGFLLPIGSPANILAMAMAEKENRRISMMEFAKIATPLGFLILAMGTGWLLLLAAFI